MPSQNAKVNPKNHPVNRELARCANLEHEGYWVTQCELADDINFNNVQFIGHNLDTLQVLIVDPILQKKGDVFTSYKGDFLPVVKVNKFANSHSYDLGNGKAKNQNVTFHVTDTVKLSVDDTKQDSVNRQQIVFQNYPIYHCGTTGHFSNRSINYARSKDKNIDSNFYTSLISREKIESMTYAGIKQIDKVLIEGVTDETIMSIDGKYIPDVKGFINQDEVEIVDTGIDGLFSNTDYSEIPMLLNEFVNEFIESNKKQTFCDNLTIYLPTTIHPVIKTGFIRENENTVKSVWEKFLEINEWEGTIKLCWTIHQLRDAATTKDRTKRAIIAFNNAEVMEWALSMEPTLMNPVQNEFGVVLPMEWAFSPLQVKQPEGIRYIDGV